MYAKNEKIYPTYVSKNEGWHYITVKKLSALLRGVLSKHNGYFYC